MLYYNPNWLGSFPTSGNINNVKLWIIIVENRESFRNDSPVYSPASDLLVLGTGSRRNIL